MSYVGQKIQIPLGKFGARTDDPNQELAPGELYAAKNVSFVHGMLEKSPGTKKINFANPLPTGTVNAIDWSSRDGTNYIFAAGKNGQLYRFNQWQYWSSIAAKTAAEPASLTNVGQTHFVSTEPTLENGIPSRKLIYFSGGNVPQVIEGDTLVRRNMSKPAVEWGTGNYPFFGIVYANRLYTLSTGKPHQILVSALATGDQTNDFEDFQTVVPAPNAANGLQWLNIFPGEGERLVTMFMFRGNLYAVKYPTGLYQILTDGSFVRIGTSFGAISPHSVCETMDDLVVSNQWGSLTSVVAAFTLGSVKFADVLGMLRCEDMIRNETDPLFPDARWCVYYGDKKQAYFTYRSGDKNKILLVDFNNNKAKASLTDFANPKYLFMLRDEKNVYRPAFGGDDGYIYMFDSPERLSGYSDNGVLPVVGSSYHMDVIMPYMDFGQDINKLFDAVEIEAENTGHWNLYCDVFVDDQLIETCQFIQCGYPVLTSGDSNCFVLDQSRLVGKNTNSVIRYIHGRGRNISLRLYDTGSSSESFKVTKVTIYARLGAEDKKTQ